MSNQEVSVGILSDITVFNKYAKYDEDKQRRETWEEIVTRNKDMHTRKFPDLKKEIERVYKLVYEKKVLPSMRSMQFAGRPIEINPARIFNCAYTPVDDWRVFSEVMHLLLGGTGVGYSVQSHHVEKIPPLKKPNLRRNRRYLIGDSIEGWADAVKILIKSYIKGSSTVVFDFSDIRPKGTKLVTAGGKAPGAQPLKECLIKLRGILDSVEEGCQLTTLQSHDMICHIADAVLAGGIRRAACISLFDLEDQEMLSCKFGNWWENNPHRGRANNSIVLPRYRTTKEQFDDLWGKIKESGSGEPGFVFTNNKEYGINPCFTGETVIAVADGRNGISIKELAEQSKGEIKFPVYSSRYSTISNQRGDSGSFRKWKPEIKNAVAFQTGIKEVLQVILSDGSSFKCTEDHRLALPNGEYVQAKGALNKELQGFYTYVDGSSGKKHRYINSFSNGYVKQHRLIWEFYNGKKPRGSEIDHLENNGYDGVENLQLLTSEEHRNKTGNERRGENNGVHKIKNNKDYLNNLSVANFGENNSNYSGLTDLDLIKIGKECFLKNLNITRKGCREINPKFPANFSKNRFKGDWGLFKNIVMGVKKYEKPKTPERIEWKEKVENNYENPIVTEIINTGEKEPVYDLTVEDNHNFYILTSFDEDFKNSQGVLVHNCAEVSLKASGFCNLSEVNVNDVESQEDLEERCEAAAFIGTLQASYTDFHYLRPIWQKTAEEDALIGVGMTGIASGKVLGLDIKAAAKKVKETNRKVSGLIGINEAARCTVIKPSGTSSIVLGSSSGIHAWFDDYYIRRVRIGKNESLYRHLNTMHPELVQDEYFRPHDTAVIEVPQKAPEGSITRNEDVIDFLERVKKFNVEWIGEGHRTGDNKNNVSATVSLKDDEWERVGEWMWKNRETYTGLSVLPYDGGTYRQAPFEKIDKQRYEELIEHLTSIDLKGVVETDDNTDLSGEVACAGGACEIK